MYEDIVESMSVSSSSSIKNKVKMNKFKIISGWNRKVKELYKKSRNCHKVWINEGRNRFGFNYEEMKEIKKKFKKSLKIVKRIKILKLLSHLKKT